MQIALYNNVIEDLNFSENDIINILDLFDLKQVDIDGTNLLMHILFLNGSKKYRFNKNQILSIIDKFDLSQTDAVGNNALAYIISNINPETININKEIFFSIFDKFDLSQKNRNKDNFYDILIYQKKGIIRLFNNDDLLFLISKIDIEITDKKNNIILINELENGLYINSDILTKKILNTENKDIINCVYKHIKQICWKQEELFLFLKKNNLEIKQNII